MPEMRGADLVTEYLVREKVPYLFGYAGHGAVGLLDSVYDRQDELKVIFPRIETGAGYMADAYYRVSHEVIPVYTSTGPGPISYQWFRNNIALNPAVTTPTLSVGPLSLADAGTYTVKVTNPAATVSHSSVLGVIRPEIPRVVVGRGRTAILPITSSANVTTAFLLRATTGSW